MTVEFPDISHYQAGLSLAGAVAVIAKATQGVSYVDPSYGGFKAQAAALKIPFSGYHWIDGSDPAAQARWYHDHAAGAPCMWDAEADGATVSRILAATAALKALGGHAWGAYLPHWWWQGHIGSPDLRPLEAAGLVLVSSNYTSTPGAGWVPYGGVTPTVWQYTDAQLFNGQHCDFNRYQGTAAELAALFAGTTPSSTEDEMPKFVRVSDGSTPGAVWSTNGVQRYHIPDPGAYAVALKTWGLTQADVVSIREVDLPAFGADAGLMGSGSSPAVIATAVVDEMHNRLAS